MTFTPTNIDWTPDPYKRITYRGVTLNQRTAAMMEVLQTRLGRAVDAVPQGSYHGGVGASGGTHDGGGAVDIFDHQLDRVQRIGRAVGFAMWHRTFLPGPNGWDPHCHGIALGDKEASDAARAQWPDYRDYKNGLSDHGPDNTWHPFPDGGPLRPFFNYVKWLGAQDMHFSDKVPGTNSTVGDALRAALATEESLKAFRANIFEFRTNEAEFRAETSKALTDLQASVDALK